MSDGHNLRMLSSGLPCTGFEVVRRGGGICITSTTDVIPIYAFKMDEGLMGILKQYKHVWMTDDEEEI